MQLLRKVASFSPSEDDLKNIYIIFIRSLLEQSATVWHSSLTQENIDDLERVQRSALKIILKDKYKDYTNALKILDIETLQDRREQLCLNFAIKCVKHPKSKEMFPLNPNPTIGTRYHEKFKVQHAHNERLKDSPVIYMQKLLNEHERKNNK